MRDYHGKAVILNGVAHTMRLDEFEAFLEGDQSQWSNTVPSKIDRRLRNKYAEISNKYSGRSDFCFGYFGTYATDVMSNADKSANREGLEFYQGLWKRPCTFEFKTRNISLKSFSETSNPSVFSNSLKVLP